MGRDKVRLFHHFSFLGGRWRAWYEGFVTRVAGRYPGVEFEIVDEHEARLGQYLSAHASDVVLAVLPLDAVYGYARRNQLAVLDGTLPRDARNAYLPRALDGCRYGGALCAVPRFIDVNLLLYRKGMTRPDPGVPVGWDTAGAAGGICTCGQADQPGLGFLFFQHLLETAAIRQEKRSCVLDRNKGADALALFKRTAESGTIRHRESLFRPLETILDVFDAEGAGAFYFTTDTLLYDRFAWSRNPGRFGTVSFRSSADRTYLPLVSGNAMAIPANTRYPELAVELLALASDFRLCAGVASDAGFLPSLNVFNKYYDDGLSARGGFDYRSELSDGVLLNEVKPYYWDIAPHLVHELRAVIEDGKDVATAADRLYEAFWLHGRRGTFRETVNRTLDFIESRFDEPLTLDQVADAVAVSPDHLNRQMKLETGYTCMDHLIRIRMERARGLLNHTGLPVQEIAARVGYGDPYYFSRLFKQKTGMAPKYFREHEV